jgi:hypothetical protein
MPDVFGTPAVTCLRAFFHCTQGCGCIDAPGISRALWFFGGRFANDPEAIASREGGRMPYAPIQIQSSCPDLIRASINLVISTFERAMDGRVKPGHDENKERGEVTELPFDI